MKILGKYPKLRLRRIRKNDWIRRLVSENKLSVDDLILPIFIREGKNKIEPIKTMPGINRYSLDKLNIIMNKVKKYKIPMVAIFPYTPTNKKNNLGTEALNKNNLVCKSLRLINTTELLNSANLLSNMELILKVFCRGIDPMSVFSPEGEIIEILSPIFNSRS